MMLPVPGSGPCPHRPWDCLRSARWSQPRLPRLRSPRRRPGHRLTQRSHQQISLDESFFTIRQRPSANVMRPRRAARPWGNARPRRQKYSPATVTPWSGEARAGRLISVPNTTPGLGYLQSGNLPGSPLRAPRLTARSGSCSRARTARFLAGRCSRERISLR